MVFESTSVLDQEISCTFGALGRVDRESVRKVSGGMIDTEDHRCPTCDSTDLVIIDTKAIADKLLECRGCKSIYQMEHQSDGTTRLVRL